MDRASSDPNWIATAVAAHERALRSYVIHLLGSQDEAGDIVQEAFARLCQQGQRDVSLPEWLFVVCRNLSIDRMRKERRMSLLDVKQSEPITEERPSMRIERADESKQLLDLLGDLPPRQQEAIRLKFQHEMSYQQIANVMNASVNNVGVLIHTGLKTLREKMK
jgi:RNA polymerase sigma-70 factor (ECF subfamily)